MARPMGKLTLTQGNTTLDQCVKLFSVFNFTKSANEISKIKTELNGNKNFKILNTTFKVLQTTFVVEYNTTAHRIQCSTFFKKRVNLAFKLNLSGLNNINLDTAWGKMILHRAQARKVLMILDKILKTGAKTDEEKAISISYLYLASIDGVYGKNLKDVLIFDILSNQNTVNYKQVEKMKLIDIQNHFANVNGSDCLFEGWDEDIRNAIAHSSFWYDIKTKKIVYEERRKNKTKIKTIGEAFEMIKKLSDLDELVFFYNQIFRINKIISDLK